MVNYGYDYGGGTDLSPTYGSFINYRLPMSQVGTSLNPSVANQIQEATNALNQGFKTIEVGAISDQLFDQIPKDHFKELARLQKITGSQASLHAPIQGVEVSGIDEQGQFEESRREIMERHLKEVIDKAHDMDPNGNIPVTMHSANMRGTTYIRGKEGEDKFKTLQLVAFDQETGKVSAQFKEETKYSPGKKGEGVRKVIHTPEEQLEIANNSQWLTKLNDLVEHKKIAEEVLGNNILKLSRILEDEDNGKFTPREQWSGEEQAARDQLDKASISLNNVEASVHAMFDQAYKYPKKNFVDSEGNKVDLKKELEEISNNWSEATKKFNNEAIENQWVNPKGRITTNNGKIRNLQFNNKMLDKALLKFRELPGPEVLIPVEEFAKDKSSETFANVALHSYKKYGKKAPIIGIENLYPGMAFAKPEDFKGLIDETRKKFIDKAKAQGMSSNEAVKAANQVIGVTWDVGHLNMLRQYGFKEKDLIEATKLMSKDIKHVHLTDNFGYSDAHLAPGMGNVPIKEHLKVLEKAGVLQNSKVINEIGGFVQQFKTSPLPYMLEAFGTPTGGEAIPYWNQAVWNQGDYFSGYGNINPDIHHSIFGRGFTALPQELGGNMPGAQSSRTTGTPLA